MYNEDRFFRYKSPWPPGDPNAFCHQCRRKSKRLTMKFEECDHAYCVGCIMTKYEPNTIAFEATSSHESCPKCSDICSCSNCTLRRGEEYQYSRHLRPKDDLELVSRVLRGPGVVRAKHNPYQILDQMIIKPTTFFATLYDLNNEPFAHTFLGVDGNTDFVVARPMKRRRVFIGAVQEHWGLGSSPLLSLEPTPKPTHKPAGKPRYYIGQESVLSIPLRPQSSLPSALPPMEDPVIPLPTTTTTTPLYAPAPTDMEWFRPLLVQPLISQAPFASPLTSVANSEIAAEYDDAQHAEKARGASETAVFGVGDGGWDPRRADDGTHPRGEFEMVGAAKGREGQPIACSSLDVAPDCAAVPQSPQTDLLIDGVSETVDFRLAGGDGPSFMLPAVSGVKGSAEVPDPLLPPSIPYSPLPASSVTPLSSLSAVPIPSAPLLAPAFLQAMIPLTLEFETSNPSTFFSVDEDMEPERSSRHDVTTGTVDRALTIGPTLSHTPIVLDSQMGRVETGNPDKKIPEEVVASPSSKSVEWPLMSPQDLQEAALQFRQDVERRIEELKRLVQDCALDLARGSRRPLDDIRSLLATADEALLPAPSPSAASPPTSLAVCSNAPPPVMPGTPVLQGGQMLPRPLGASSTTTPTPQINRTPRPPPNVLSATPPSDWTTLRSEVVESLRWGLRHGSGNDTAIMHYGDHYERMVEARFGWRLKGWPVGVKLESPSKMPAGGSGAVHTLWQRLNSGDCYWEKMPETEHQALQTKHASFKRKKVKGQEHDDGPQSSTLGKRRRDLPGQEVDQATSGTRAAAHKQKRRIELTPCNL
ncbi:hypothetical protein B0H14DRAFT_2599194 [Mycena olivaceomarginata]|nr:hypothetical protein B0H14DRAFT_2599194 [Mycena olivaceomarginata]